MDQSDMGWRSQAGLPDYQLDDSGALVKARRRRTRRQVIT